VFVLIPDMTTYQTYHVTPAEANKWATEHLNHWMLLALWHVSFVNLFVLRKTLLTNPLVSSSIGE